MSLADRNTVALPFEISMVGCQSRIMVVQGWHPTFVTRFDICVTFWRDLGCFCYPKCELGKPDSMQEGHEHGSS